MDESAITKITNNIVSGSQHERHANTRSASHQLTKSLAKSLVKETCVSQTSRRCTLYESQQVEETIFGEFASTPAARRKTMNFSNKFDVDLSFKTPQMHTVTKHSFIQEGMEISCPFLFVFISDYPHLYPFN